MNTQSVQTQRTGRRAWFGLPLMLSIVVVFASSACGPSKDQYDLVRKAKEKMGDCRTMGDRVFTLTGERLVWNLETDEPHRVAELLDDYPFYTGGNGPVTVLLVSGKLSEKVGTYSVSKEPAYREWVDVYVVQFSDLADDGKALGVHEVVGLDPRRERPVQYTPEYGDINAPIADWIRSLPD